GTHRAVPATDKLGGRGDALAGVDGPFGVVEIEDGNGGDEVNVGVVEGVDGANVPPVGTVAFRRTRDVIKREVIDSGFTLVHEVGNDVPAHVVLCIEALGVNMKRLNKGVGVEKIVAHGGEELGGIGGRPGGLGG